AVSAIAGAARRQAAAAPRAAVNVTWTNVTGSNARSFASRFANDPASRAAKRSAADGHHCVRQSALRDCADTSGRRNLTEHGRNSTHAASDKAGADADGVRVARPAISYGARAPARDEGGRRRRQ